MRAFWDTKAYLDIYINRRQFWREKNTLNFFFGEEAILRRKNSTVEGWWNGDTRRYHQKWSEAIDQEQFFHQVTFTMIWVCYQSCALKKKVWNLRRGPRTLRSLALPYFNSEDSQRFTIWKVTRRNVVFYYHLVRANRKKTRCFREKKGDGKTFFPNTAVVFL